MAFEETSTTWTVCILLLNHHHVVHRVHWAIGLGVVESSVWVGIVQRDWQHEVILEKLLVPLGIRIKIREEPIVFVGIVESTRSRARPSRKVILMSVILPNQ